MNPLVSISVEVIREALEESTKALLMAILLNGRAVPATPYYIDEVERDANEILSRVRNV